MTDALFEDRRAHLSHYVLRNGLLNRLSSPPDLWSDPRLTGEEKVQALTDGWKDTLAKPNSSVLARRAWFEPIHPHPDARQLVRELVRDARRLSQVVPSAAFPTDETVETWLRAIDAVVHNLGRQGHGWPRHEVESFWRALLALTAFITGIQQHGPRFWEYFE